MRPMVIALLLGAATPTLAQTPPTPPEGAPPPGDPMRAGMLVRADANGDGAITRAEAIAEADTRFDRLDANRDGTVTPGEMRAARDAMRGRGGPDGPPPPPRDGRPRGDRPRPVGQPLTREQSRTRTLEAFARADVNGDGTVDAAERAHLRPVRGSRPSGDMPPPAPQN